MTDYQSLKETPTWAVAVVCFVLVALSILLEHILHLVGKWLKNRDKIALCEALEKIKAELMLMGFLSFLLTVTQDYVARICIPKSVGATWHPCDYSSEKENGTTEKEGRKLLQFSDSFAGARRSLAETGTGPCAAKGMVPFVSSYSIHQLHIFIFVLAVFHIVYCITTLALGTIKMRIWKKWENETKTLEYRCHNDPERFRFARETTFGRRHLSAWSQTKVSLWIVCFFRQFFRSVTKVDYLTLRHGFIMAHLTPESETKFDFQKYISRSLEEDFKVVVGISPIMWLFAVFFLLTTTYGWYSYLWLPFIPLIIILTVGTKLQVIITRMGLSTQDRGHVVKGAPLVQPGDDLFWFKRPRLVLFLIHFILFQNAYQLAFLLWSVYEELDSCYHKRVETIVIKVSIGVIIQVLCSYVTLPLYALVTQMGSTMRPTIFNDKVLTALKQWHHTAKKHTKHSHHSDATPFTSLPATPTHAMSPVHLLHNYNGVDSLTFQATPRTSNADADHWDGAELTSLSNLEAGGGGNGGSGRDGNSVLSEEDRRENQEPSGSDQHEVGITFHFEK